jgi:hypothetical protein
MKPLALLIPLLFSTFVEANELGKHTQLALFKALNSCVIELEKSPENRTTDPCVVALVLLELSNQDSRHEDSIKAALETLPPALQRKVMSDLNIVTQVFRP